MRRTHIYIYNSKVYIYMEMTEIFIEPMKQLKESKEPDAMPMHASYVHEQVQQYII